MALALDASTPAKVTKTNSGTTLTTASFTAPANALLVMFVGGDGSGAGEPTYTASDSGGLTWTKFLKYDNAGTANTPAGTGTNGNIWGFYATTTTSAARTVTATQSSAQYAMMSVKVFTDTGGAPTLGAVAAGTGSLPSKAVTTTAANSWVWGLANDWNQAGLGTAGTGQTIVDEYNPSGFITAHLWKQNSTTASSGTSVTMNLTAPSGEDANFAAIEIKANGSSSTNATVTPSVVAAVAAVPAPTVSLPKTVTPSTVAAVAAVPTSTEKTGSTAKPSAVAAVAAVGSPRLYGISGDLKNWRSAYDAYLAGTGTAKIVVMGDSIAEGLGTSGTVKDNRWMGKVQSQLRRTGAGGMGYVSAAYIGGGIPQDVDYRSTNVTNDLMQHGYGGKGATVNGGGVVYWPSTTCDRIRLYYGKDIFSGWMDVCDDLSTSILTNGSFETDTSSWSGAAFGYDTATLSTSTAHAYTGSQSMKVDWAATTGASLAFQGISTTAGKRYTFSCKVYVPSGNPDVQAQEYGTPSGKLITTKDAWVEAHYSWTETTTGTRYLGVTKPAGQASGGVCYIDDAKVQETLFSVDTNASGQELVWDSGALSSATRQLVVRNSANPDYGIRVTGAEFFNGDYSAGLRVYDASVSGSETNFHANTLGMGTYDNLAIDQPNLVIVALGNNDAYTMSAATYKTNLQTIVNRVNTQVTGSHSILLIAPYYDARNSTLIEAWANYTTAAQQVAEENPNVGWYSAQTYWPTLTSDGSNNQGLMYESTYPLHPNNTGQQRLADVVYTALFGIDPAYPATAAKPSVAAVAAVGAPAISTGVTVTPATVAAVAAVPAPTLHTGETVTASVVAAVAAVPAPSVTNSTNATVTPTAVAAVAAVGSPTITASSVPTPAVVAGVAAVPSPSVKTGETATPAAVAAVAAVGSPTILTTVKLTPSTVAGVAAVGSPAVHGNATATPAAVAAVAAVPAPSIQTAGNSTVGTATVAAVASVGSPTITVSTSATVTPSAVTAVASVPTPTVETRTPASVTVSVAVIAAVADLSVQVQEHTGSTVSATPVVATTAVGSPSVSAYTDATVTPSTVAVTAALPSPTLTTGCLVAPASLTASGAVSQLRGLTTTSTHYYFTTPSVREKYIPLEEAGLGRRLGLPTGEHVLKVGGFYSLHPEAISDEQIAAADVAYLAGHEYLITESERSDLIAAGYGAYITSRLE